MLTESVSGLKRIFDALPYPVFAKDAELKLIYGNKAFTRLVGRKEAASADMRDQLHRIYQKEDAQVLSGHETIVEERMGNAAFALTRKMPLKLPDGSTGMVGIVINAVTGTESGEIKDALQKTSNDDRTASLQRQLMAALNESQAALKMARTDPLTGLRNRLGFEQDMYEQIDKSKKTGDGFTVTLLDLDLFKRINDQFGHATGDTVLKVFSKRLRKVFYVESIARLGGDEFGLISKGHFNNIEERRAELQRGLDYVFKPIVDGGRRIFVTGSIGYCRYPDDAKTPAELLRCADLALFTSKRNGRNQFQCFNEKIRERSDRRSKIETRLSKAIKTGSIRPHYQPIVCSDTLRPVGVEALARWTDQDLGVIDPDEFIKVACETGMVGKLDERILTLAGRDVKAWLDKGLIEYVALNASPNAIISRGYASKMIQNIQNAGLNPKQVCLEIVEHSFVSDTVSARKNLTRLDEAGVRIAIDDYGTGYSNLRTLLDFPFKQLKIDRSLISDIERNAKTRTIFNSTVEIGPRLNLWVVAEGIETEEQRQIVRDAGCAHMQGYFIARPMNASSTVTWLQKAVSKRDPGSRVA